jgi:uncharacterized protein (DUF2062 family)
MKTIATLVFIWLMFNMIALIANILFSNIITGSITFLSIFALGAWAIAKIVKDN